MTDSKVGLCLVSVLTLLQVLQPGVSADGGFGNNSTKINCTTDADCPSNWKCLDDPQITCENEIWPDFAAPSCFRSLDVNPTICVGVPDQPATVEVRNQSLSLDGTTVEMNVSWSGTTYPFSVITLIDLLRFTENKTHVSRVVHSGPYDEIPRFTHHLIRLAGKSKYSLYLTVVSAAGSSPVYGPVNFTTIVSVPAAVKNVQAERNREDPSVLTLRFQCPDRFFYGGELSTYIVQGSRINESTYGPCLFQYNKSDCLNVTSAFHVGSVVVGNKYIVKTSDFYLPIRDDTCRDQILKYDFVDGFEVGKTYVLTVQIQNEVYEGLFSDPVYITIEDIVPGSNDDDDNDKTFLIIGLSVGIGATLFLAVFGWIYCKRSRRWPVKNDFTPF